jgi:hypothetical protein
VSKDLIKRSSSKTLIDASEKIRKNMILKMTEMSRSKITIQISGELQKVSEISDVEDSLIFESTNELRSSFNNLNYRAYICRK